MARKHYEGSAEDLAEDKRGAKKHGMTMKQWEASEEDEEQDESGEAKMSGKNVPDHHYAFGKPRVD